MTIRKLRSNVFFPAAVAAVLAIFAAPANAAATDVSTTMGRSAPTPAAPATVAAAARSDVLGRDAATGMHDKSRYQVEFELVEKLRSGSDVHVADRMGRSAAPSVQRAQWSVQFSAAGDDPES